VWLKPFIGRSPAGLPDRAGCAGQLEMLLNRTLRSAGPYEPPVSVDVLIEIPRGSFLKRGSTGRIDFVSPFPCPFNYGSVPTHLGLEGDLLDAVVLGPRLAAGTRLTTKATTSSFAARLLSIRSSALAFFASLSSMPSARASSTCGVVGQVTTPAGDGLESGLPCPARDFVVEPGLVRQYHSELPALSGRAEVLLSRRNGFAGKTWGITPPRPMAGIRYPQPLGGAVGESCSGSAGRDNGESEGTAVERGRSVVVHAPSGRGAGRAGPDSRRRLQ
jgi:hypothetical protein